MRGECSGSANLEINERVARVNPAAFHRDGSLKSLLEQYGESQMLRMSNANYRAPGPYILASDGGFARIDKMVGRPLVLTARSLKHILRRHDAEVAALARLLEEIDEHVLAYENPEDEDKITIVLDAKSNGGHDVIAVVKTGLTMNQVGVSAVRSVHGRTRKLLMDSMAKSLELNRAFHLREKSGAWLEIQKHIPNESGVAKEVLKRLSTMHDSKFPIE